MSASASANTAIPEQIVMTFEIATGVHHVAIVAMAGMITMASNAWFIALALQPIEGVGRQRLRPTVVNPHQHTEHHDGDEEVEEERDIDRAGDRTPRPGLRPRRRFRARRSRSPER